MAGWRITWLKGNDICQIDGHAQAVESMTEVGGRSWYPVSHSWYGVPILESATLCSLGNPRFLIIYPFSARWGDSWGTLSLISEGRPLNAVIAVEHTGRGLT